jgi:hypothetical protein
MRFLSKSRHETRFNKVFQPGTRDGLQQVGSGVLRIQIAGLALMLGLLRIDPFQRRTPGQGVTLPSAAERAANLLVAAHAGDDFGDFGVGQLNAL